MENQVGPLVEPRGATLLLEALPKELVKRADLVALRAECEACLAQTDPIKVDRFAYEFERMSVHYRSDDLNDGEAQILREDWLRLAGHLPEDLFRLALDRYLTGPHRFRPTVGQVLDLVKSEWAFRSRLAERARQVLALIDNSKAT